MFRTADNDNKSRASVDLSSLPLAANVNTAFRFARVLITNSVKALEAIDTLPRRPVHGGRSYGWYLSGVGR